MDILISYRYREDDLAPLPLEELTRFVLESERRPDATEVSVSFVDDAVIAELNEKYRGKHVGGALLGTAPMPIMLS